MKRRLMYIALCILSGAATGVCLLIPEIGPVVFLTAVPAFACLLRKNDVFGCAAFCVALCMVGYFPAFYIRPDLAEGLIFWVDFSVWTVLCTVHGAVLTVALWLGFKLPCPKNMRWMYVALCWTLAEWLIGAGPFAWPTLRLSLALWKYPLLLQSAHIGGQLMVSAIILSVNTLLAQALNQRRFGCFPLWLAVAVFTANLTIGFIVPVRTDADTRIALIQPGMTTVGGYRKAEIHDQAFELAEQAAQEEPELIVLPESVLPHNFAEYEYLHTRWGNLSRDIGADLISGGNKDNRSAAFYFGASGELEDVRKKVRQVPFFENGAYEDFCWTLEENGGTLDAACGEIGVMICYESMFSAAAREHALAGAHMLAVLTNDSWFNTQAAQNLHLANGVYRAVETGRTLVQAALNGSTAAVDAKGNVTAQIDHDDAGVLYTEISLKPQNTLYLLWGDWWIALWITAALAVMLIEKTRCQCGS